MNWYTQPIPKGLIESVPYQWKHNIPKQRVFFDWLGKQLGYKGLEDWYNVSVKDILEHDGRLLTYYSGSPSKALQSIYPEHEWELRKFKHKPSKLWDKKTHQTELFFGSGVFKAPRNHWSDVTNHKQYFDWLGEQLGYKSMEDWYNVTVQDICDHGGQGLLKHYGDSPSKAVQNVYPEHQWIPYKFRMPIGYWHDTNHQAVFFDWLGKQLNIGTMFDWYHVTKEDVYKYGGRELLDQQYKGSLQRALKTVYPQHFWIAARFNVPIAHWKKMDNQRKFFDELKTKLGFESMDDWYSLKKADVIANKGSGLLNVYYGGSIYEALKKVYPEYEWDSSKFTEDTSTSQVNHKAFFDMLATRLGYKNMDDWYNVTSRDIYRHGGKSLLQDHYAGSPYRALKSVYSQHDWLWWQFRFLKQEQQQFLGNPDEQKRLIEWLENKLELEFIDQWNKVSMAKVWRHVPLVDLLTSKVLFGILKNVHPSHPWDFQTFNKSKDINTQNEMQEHAGDF